ncbi:MAG: ECF transporter S component [Bacillota bacterium]|nr:ECF transporter S component [Bacillota bacterium]
MNKTMVNRRLTTKNMAIIALLGALTAVLGMTPLGFIPIGPTRATIMHIPVIVGSIAYGPVVGGFVGLIFGISSLVNALVNMTPVSFVFLNPLVSILPRVLIGIGTYYAYQGVKSIGGPRTRGLLLAICTGVLAYLGYGSYKTALEANWLNLGINIILIVLTLYIAYVAMTKYLDQSFEVVLAAAIGTIINTFGVLTMIYLLYGGEFVAALGQNADMAKKIIFSIALVNGLPECIIAIILVTNVVNKIREMK